MQHCNHSEAKRCEKSSVKRNGIKAKSVQGMDKIPSHSLRSKEVRENVGGNQSWRYDVWNSNHRFKNQSEKGPINWHLRTTARPSRLRGPRGIHRRWIQNFWVVSRYFQNSLLEVPHRTSNNALGLDGACLTPLMLVLPPQKGHPEFDCLDPEVGVWIKWVTRATNRCND